MIHKQSRNSRQSQIISLEYIFRSRTYKNKINVPDYNLKSDYPLAKTGAIVSNIPVIVTENKNYTSSEPTWLTSPFFRAGYEDVIKVYTGSDVPSTDYTFTFSSALPGIPNLAYGIKEYRGNDYLGQEFYQIKKIGLTASTFSVSIQIFGVTNLWKLSVAYLAVDPTFPHHLNSFDNVPINATGGDIVNISSKSSQLQYYTQYINYTWQTEGRPFTKFTTPLSSNKIVLFMSSLWIKGTFGTQVYFHMTTQVINQTFYMWNATLEKNVVVTNVHFSQLIFNSDDVQSSEKYFIVYSLWYNDANGGFIPIPQEFVDNFIMGVTTFQCSSAACGFQYQWMYATKTIDGKEVFGVEILKSWTLTNTCGFSWSETSIFYMMTWQCTAPYYYFNLTSGLCQTLCGGYNVEDETEFVCVPCKNTLCYQCDDPNTNLCNDCASFLHYQLVNGQCVCMSGYLRSASECSLCWDANAGCYNCSYNDGADGTLPYDSNKFVCLSCNETENYFMDGTRCSKCSLSNCPDCQNLTACSVCEEGYDFSQIQTCIICHVVGCLHCALTDPDICVTCNQSMGYYQDTSTQKCKTICGDGIYVSAEEGCDDGNLADFDGCSATCTVEPSFSCQDSPSACTFAETVILSIDSQKMEENICNTITFGFRFTPPSETFAQPYIEWKDFLSSPNDSLLIPNHSMTVYNAGVLSVSYFLMGHLQNQTLVFGADFTVLLPNSTILNNTSAPTLDFSVSTSPEALMFCCLGYFMNEQEVRCDQICGDGILFYLPCDDGNLVNADGCSSTCTIETDYVCMNGSTTSSSVCSYNGTFSVALQTGDKSPSSNSLTLTYKIEPSAPMLSLNQGSTNFASMVSFPNNPGVTVTSATLDPSTNQLVINVDYSESLQDEELSLQLTPPDIPQAVLVPNVSSTWIVKPTNQLAAVVYSEQDYATVEKLTPLANGLLGSYLTVMVLTLVFRKYIGLQLAALYQISFLSLLQNTQVSTYSQPISGWNNVFGYNNLYMSPLPKERFVSPYALYGYQKYFEFSNNAMVIFTGAVFGVAILLLAISMLTSKSVSRKIKTASSMVAGEVGYALVIFGTPNIITALCIEAQEGVIFQADYIWSKGFLIVSLGLLISAHIVQFSTAEDSPDVGTYLRKHSKSGIYMPIVLSIRTITITVLLFVYHITQDVPQYFIVLVQVSYVLFIIFGRPHKKIFDFVRSLCLQIGLLYTLTMRFVEVKVLSEYANEDSTLFAALAYTEYSIYGLSSTLSTISLIYHVVKAIKGKKKVSPEKEEIESPERKFSNESLAKVQPSPSKRKLNENPLIFDIQDAEIPNTSVMSFDSKNSLMRGKTRKSRNK